MDIGRFATDLQVSLASGLPGLQAQYKMAVAGRLENMLKGMQGKEPRLSGVLVYFYPHNGEINLLLTQRHEYEGVHSGQISFPGGKKEPDDPDMVFTAIREAKEEAGIIVPRQNVIGSLTELYIPPSNFMVYPTLAYDNQRPDFQIDPYEVKELIELPVSYLIKGEIVSSRRLKLSEGMSMTVPVFDLGEKFIWGATAMILSELIEIISRDKLLV